MDECPSILLRRSSGPLAEFNGLAEFNVLAEFNGLAEFNVLEVC